jgi:hypothetical protein
MYEMTSRWTAVAVAVVALAAVPVTFAAPPGASPTANQQSPGQRCSAQLADVGSSAFKQLYAQDLNANQKNAFGKCVSKLNAQDQQNADKASALCRAEQADSGFAAVHSGKTFNQLYGTGKNLKNAFGNCVSGKTNAAAQQQQQSTIKAAKTCRTLQKNSQATFATNYGTKKNAFGKCVAAHTNP